MQELRNRRNPYYQGVRSSFRQKRVIHKSGDRNVIMKKGTRQTLRFYQDLYNTVIDAKWRYVFTLFALSFFGTWFGFAVLWYLIGYAHGDFSVDPVTGQPMTEGAHACLEGVNSFVACILMSIETQTSIGFGERFPGEECPEAVFLMAAQIVVAYAIEGAMIGIVYAKMVRPPRRASNMKFSRRALICQRDSKLCLVFRVSDPHAIHVVDTSVEAFWIEEHESTEQDSQPIEQSMKLENDGKVFLIFPTTVCHVIDEDSPLYAISQEELADRKFEIVVTMTGSSRSTGQVSQSRTSYLSREISWGRRFVNMNYYDQLEEVYVADYDRLDSTETTDMSSHSAQQLEEIQDETAEFLNQQDTESGYDPEHLNLIGGNGMILERNEEFDDISESVCSEQYIKPSQRVSMERRNRTSDSIKQQMQQLDKLVEELECGMTQSSKDLLREIQTDCHRRENFI